MLGRDVIELLESGCSLVIPLVTADGRPPPGAGWALSIGDDGRRARVLVSAADVEALDHDAGAALG